MAAVKTTGEEFNRFYKDDAFWGEGTWHDDTLILVDGEARDDLDNLPPTAKVVIETGVIVYQNLDGQDDKTEDMLKFFRRWKKTVKSVSFMVTVNKTSNIQQIKVDIAAMEGVQSVK